MEILHFPTASREFSPTHAMIMAIRHGPKEGKNGPLSRRGIAITHEKARTLAETYAGTDVVVRISTGDISRVVQTGDIFEREFTHFMPFRQRVRRLPHKPELSAHAIIDDFRHSGLLQKMREHVTQLENSPWYKFRKTQVDDEAMGKALVGWMEKGDAGLQGTVPFTEVQRIHAYWLRDAMNTIREAYAHGEEIMDIRVSHEIQAFVLGTFACRTTRRGIEDGMSIMKRRKGKTLPLTGPQFQLFSNDIGEMKFCVKLGKTWYDVDEELVNRLASSVVPLAEEALSSAHDESGLSIISLRRRARLGYPIQATKVPKELPKVA